MKEKKSKLVYGFFMLYIAFLPIGPYPITVPGINIKLDVLAGIILAVLLIPNILDVLKGYPQLFIVSLMVYGFISFISACLSYDVLFSLEKWGMTMGYMLVSISVPYVFVGKLEKSQKWLLLIGFIISVTIIGMFYFGGFNEGKRFYFVVDGERLDPNMTSTGLLLTILITLPLIIQKHKNLKQLLFRILCLVGIFSASLVTMSRSATLSFVLAIVLVAIYEISNKAYMGSFSSKQIKFAIILGIFLLASGSIVFVYSYDVIMVLVNRFMSSPDDGERIRLITESIDAVGANIKTLIIGEGYYTNNPHNEWLRHLYGAGFLGLISYFGIISSLYFAIILKIKKKKLYKVCASSIFVFINVAILFYGHSKTFWSSIMFICFLFLEDKIVTREIEVEDRMEIYCEN